MIPITEISSKIELGLPDIEVFGAYKAKINPEVWKKIKNKPTGNLILVTAMTPTPLGEGKTTMAIGLGQGLSLLGKKVILALREPSLGPVFGMKGGATGGGLSKVEPSDDINLHFNGDFHAITSAQNLLASLIDNHIYWGNSLGIDPSAVTWKRSLDTNDRSLRRVIVRENRAFPETETGFVITAASEIMAIFCLASDFDDLRNRLGNIVIGFNFAGNPVTAHDLKAVGAMSRLLEKAFYPNLVQTTEGVPALVHGGPFANIAHGCNSLVATKYALKLSDYVVTEAGFGADLGAEKFFDIKCRLGDLSPKAGVVVATIKALKYHGGSDGVEGVNLGLPNLFRHIENIRKYMVEPIVALNVFENDTSEETAFVIKACLERGIKAIASNCYGDGGSGCVELAESVIDLTKGDIRQFRPLYNLEQSLEDKINIVSKEIYRAESVVFSETSKSSIKKISALGYSNIPVCIAKTQYSFSDNPKLIGCPVGYSVSVRDVRLSAGAGFLVVLAGDIMTMPGLPKEPLSDAMV